MLSDLHVVLSGTWEIVDNLVPRQQDQEVCVLLEKGHQATAFVQVVALEEETTTRLPKVHRGDAAPQHTILLNVTSQLLLRHKSSSCYRYTSTSVGNCVDSRARNSYGNYFVPCCLQLPPQSPTLVATHVLFKLNSGLLG